MPFKSKAQMKAAFGGYLGKEMKGKAKEWAKETPNIKSLPKHKKSMKTISKKKVVKATPKKTSITMRPGKSYKESLAIHKKIKKMA